MKCENCKYYDPREVDPEESGPAVYCRRLPPVPVMPLSPNPKKQQVVGNFPPVSADAWCGEFVDVVGGRG